MNPFFPDIPGGRLVLASRSPRRRDILAGLGVDFDIDPASEEAEEGVTMDDPFALAEELARRKCAEVAARHDDRLVLAADTIVILDGAVLNKPRNDEEAVAFVRGLAGRTHTVVTGVAVEFRGSGVARSASARTDVTFRGLEDEEIRAYVATGEGRDKAGSYAAQGVGAALIDRIDGCFYNVVGLPVALVVELLKEVAGS